MNRSSGGRLSQLAEAYRRSASPLDAAAAATALTLIALSFAAPWIAPYDPFDLATVNLLDSRLPPSLFGDAGFHPFGTDDQGRDILSLILFGMRTSIFVSLLSMAIAVAIGVTLGLVSGYFGGVVDALIMRLADIQLSFPAILIALLVDGIARGLIPREAHDHLAVTVIVVSIALSNWVHFARTVRGSTLVEKRKEYVLAARVMGSSAGGILRGHILPNIVEPILVLATVGVGMAIIMEATLSYLGVGLPPSQPSLGTLIRTGSDYLFSGYWWMTIFPGVALLLLVLSINLLGDTARDALNPTLH